MSNQKTDVWMPWYIGDYLKDTMHLTTEQHGAYLLLLAQYWVTEEPLPDDDQYLAAVTRLMLEAFRKHRPSIERFFTIQDGKWVHGRVEAELKRAKKNRQFFATRASKAASARWSAAKKAYATSTPPSMREAIPPPSPSPIAEREPDFPEVNLPSEHEVLTHAATIGLAPWKASDWFHEMQGCGWKDHAKREIFNWQSVLTRVKTKWEADGRPMQPPTNNYGTNNRTGNRPRVDRNKGTFNEGKADQYPDH